LIDLSFTNSIEPDKGKFLLSDPFLDEEYFRRSVIYLCEHNEDGSFGFVVNNFISLNLYELDESFPNIETKISLGGPIEVNSLYFIHTLGEKIENCVEVEDGIYLGGDFQALSTCIKEDEDLIKKVRFFIGYSGWSKDQLKNEIISNSWLVLDVNTKKDLFESPINKSWKRYMYDLGGKFKIMSKFPIDPREN